MYCASKGGVLLFIWVLVFELVFRGVWVNVLCFGDVEIFMFDG